MQLFISVEPKTLWTVDIGTLCIELPYLVCLFNVEYLSNLFFRVFPTPFSSYIALQASSSFNV